MKIYRKDLTVVVDEYTVTYESPRFRITVKKGKLTPFEKDLLRHVFAGKELPFKLPKRRKIMYNGRDKPELWFTSVGEYKDYSDVFGEYYWDYNENVIVLPGKDKIIVEAYFGNPSSISYRSEDISVKTMFITEMHPLLREFVKKRDTEVIRRYIPFGNGLKVRINGSKEDMNLRFVYGRKEVATFHVDGKEDIVRGMGVFRDGVAILKMSLEDLRKIEKNLRFGFMPKEYVEKVVARYPKLKEDVGVCICGSYMGYGVYSIVKFLRGEDWLNNYEVVLDIEKNRALFYGPGRKNKKASIKALKKYLEEAGMVER